jgi:hypothetical protein
LQCIWHIDLQLAKHAQKGMRFSTKTTARILLADLGLYKTYSGARVLRADISNASSVGRQKVCDRSPKPFLNHDEEFKPYKALIEYDNEKLSSEVMPLYDKSLEIFTSKFWLSEDSTRPHYEELYRFIEIWRRYLDGSLPMDALSELDHSEERLKPFYNEIEKNMIELNNNLKCL